MNKKNIVIVILVLVLAGAGAAFAFNKPAAMNFEEIKTEDNGAYLVKNVLYTGESRETKDLEETMRQIKATCSKQCKINLYANQKAYEIDILAGSDNFNGYTDEQRSYLSTHVLAFWNLEEGSIIEYFPAK